MDHSSTAAPPRPEARAQLVILLATVWHLLLAVYLVSLSLDILRADTLFIAGKSADLGRPVQLFAGVFLLVPAVLAILASVLLLLRRGAGRYLALGVDLSAFALSLFALFGVWGLYGSFENIVDGGNAVAVPDARLCAGLRALLRRGSTRRGRRCGEGIARGSASSSVSLRWRVFCWGRIFSAVCATRF